MISGVIWLLEISLVVLIILLSIISTPDGIYRDKLGLKKEDDSGIIILPILKIIWSTLR